MRRLLLMGLLLTAGPRAADARRHGKPAAPPPPAAEAAPAPEEEESPSEERARVHLARAQEHFDEGRYPQALTEYQIVDRMKSQPAATLGMGRCHEKLGHDEAAKELYQRVAERSPDPFDAEEARSHIAAIDKRAAAAAKAKAEQAEAEAAAEPAAAPPPPAAEEKIPKQRRSSHGKGGSSTRHRASHGKQAAQ